MKYVDVLVEYNAPGIYEYKTDKELGIGSRVLVNFAGRKSEGIALKIKDKPSFDGEIKELTDVLDPKALLNEELLDLGKEIKDYYYVSLIKAYSLMLPPSLKIKNNREAVAKKYKYVYSLIRDEKVRGINQIAILDLLKEGPKELDEIDYPRTSLKALVDKGLVKEEKIEVKRINIKTEGLDYKLTKEQEEASLKIRNSSKDTILLNGVTGSGKTFVYIDLIKKCIADGKNAIMLVPEISLTSQTIDFFKKYLNIKMAIFHSGISKEEKHEEYLKIKRGEVNLVIGARSAIFVPLDNIGLIIIDEEHTSSYRQETGVLYSTYEIARMRLKYHQFKIVLGSATPSLYTYANAIKGNYELVNLNKRPFNIEMPSIKLIDLKKEKGIYSKYLLESIKERLFKKEQIILMLNRRGYASFAICQACGEVVKCKNCDVSLTFHKETKSLDCHYCGFRLVYNKKCPHCHQYDLSVKGLGSEKIEEDMKSFFPEAKIIRMDFDTTRRKGSYEKLINTFKNHEADILVGTQMISKGLNFENVTLVSIINADTSLHIPSFASAENTFSLLMQTAGRAGRGDKKGEVIIQTYNKDHYVFTSLLKNSYLDFFKREMKFRKDLKYPPYYYLIEIRLSGRKEDKVYEEASKVASLMKETGQIILGPSSSGILKINKDYRYSVFIKYKDESLITKSLDFINKQYPVNGVTLQIIKNTESI